MTNIHLINEKNSKLDLSSVKDAKGEMVILQPKGAKGSQRECREEVLEHPHVMSFIQAKWLRYEDVSLKPIETKHVPPGAPPPASKTASENTSDDTTPPVEGDVLVEEGAPVADVPVTEETLAAETPVVEDVPPVVTSSESMDTGETLSANVTSGNRRKPRRD